MEFKHKCPYLVLIILHVLNYWAIWVSPLPLRGFKFMHLSFLTREQLGL